MKHYITIASILCCLHACQLQIKDKNATIIEEQKVDNNNTIKTIADNAQTYWVGYFENNMGKDLPAEYSHTDAEEKKAIHVDEGFSWYRENKITIAIDTINNEKIKGHSIVAGNSRPFDGVVSTDKNGAKKITAKEPGNNTYDGEFTFTLNDTALQGTWTSYKKIDITQRRYLLKKTTYTYNPNQLLDKKSSKQFVNYENAKKTHFDAEFEEFRKEYAAATEKIYAINASNTLLEKEEVENLNKGDLLIIRNAIYARHGYSFKNRPLRIFFDAQEWYIPLSANITTNFTEIEKKNIELILRYEKNAKEYYDYFGRG